MSLKLFWCPQTRASRATWLLEELGIPYQRVLIDVRDPRAERDPDFARASPMGKVPALLDGDVAMSESAAMAVYLADKYASGSLAPTIDSAERGRFLYWMFFAPAVIEPAMSERVSGTEPKPTRNGWGDFDSMVRVLIDGLSPGPWLLGNTFTVADVLVGGGVTFMRAFNMLPDHDVLQSYADRCVARPAYQKAQSFE